MFSKIGALIALAAPLASALTITTPSGWTSAGTVNITWTAVNGDPQTFSIFLINDAFHNSFGIANNIETGALEIDNLELPVVPVGDGYTLEFTNVGNQSDVFASSGDFSIGATTSSSTSAASTTASSSGVPSTAPTVTPTLPVSSSGFGQTVSATSGASSNAGSSGTGTSTTSIGSSSAFNSGAVSLGVSQGNLASFALMAVAAVAGARFAGL